MGDGKRVHVFLNHRDYEGVASRAERAGMKVTGYLRHLARGRMPPPKDREHLTAKLSVLANTLKLLAEEDDTSKLRPGIVDAHLKATEILENHLSTNE